MNNIKELKDKALGIRKRTLEIVFNASGGHIGGSLSAVEILVALYFEVMKINPKEPFWVNRDRFILSKGHAVESYYATLESRGFFNYDILNTYGKYLSPLAGHPVNKIPGIELNSGSLGHGLSVGVGMALAAKRSSADWRTFVLMGDGEQGEGSVMEAAAAAGHYHLNNLIAIVDRNMLQISGPTELVLSMEKLHIKYEASGWSVFECDGHHFAELLYVFEEIKKQKEKPSLIIAHTIKGKGVSFMENNVEWHHKMLTKEQLVIAFNELIQKQKEIVHA